MLGDLYINGQHAKSFDECVLETIPPGASDVFLASVSFPCGATLELRNVIISWGTGEENCSDQPRCSERVAKCWRGTAGTQIPVEATPLLVAFSSGSPVCLGTGITFSSQVSGGTPPYAFLWSFGDGTPSDSASELTHTYAVAGTFSVMLKLTDSTGASASMAGNVIVYSIPLASATNSGPYREGDIIMLSANGGVAFAWSGPNGFSSTSQNPTIPGATTSNAGMYSVTVTSGTGCSNQLRHPLSCLPTKSRQRGPRSQLFLKTHLHM